MIDNNEKLVFGISNIAMQAGKIIMEHYNNDSEVNFKKDKSPLTNADLQSNKFITNELSLLNDKIPILSEESLIAWNKRKTWNTYWLVDPLDGTKEFINKNGEFTVNIALIKNNEPILGVIYVPAISLLYFAQRNKGSYKISCSKNLSSLERSIRLNVNMKKKSDKIIIIGSRSHSNEKFNKWVKENFVNYDIIQKGSSLKLCEIAEGAADIYPRFGYTSEWDIAAGQIILEEAGGSILNLNNEKLFYNIKESLINPEFIASGKIF